MIEKIFKSPSEVASSFKDVNGLISMEELGLASRLVSEEKH